MGNKRKDYRRVGAVKREEERNNRTPEQQLSLLDKRLGKDIGAKKERARLHNLIALSRRPKQNKNERAKRSKPSTSAQKSTP